MSPQFRKFILRVDGALLIILGTLHLAVTPFIASLISENVTAAVGVWLTPPMLLNHVVAGTLLLPLGIFIFYAAPYAITGEPWALVVTRVSAATMTTLPVALFLLMGNRYFGATPFLIATAIVCVAPFLLPAAAFWPNRPG